MVQRISTPHRENFAIQYCEISTGYRVWTTRWEGLRAEEVNTAQFKQIVRVCAMFEIPMTEFIE